MIIGLASNLLRTLAEWHGSKGNASFQAKIMKCSFILR